MSKICIDNKLLIIGLIIIIGINYYTKKDYEKIINDKLIFKNDRIIYKEQSNIDIKENEEKENEKKEKDIIEDIRYRTLVDPLYPPTKVYNNKYIIPNYLKGLTTRGRLPQWQYVGNIAKNNDVMKLFGRAKYHGSRQWEYYASDTHEGNKFTIENLYDSNDNNKNDKELDTNDKVNIREFDGKWTVYINPNNSDIYRYNPNI